MFEAIVLTAEMECLATAVFAEARGESRAGQLYVAATLHNRVLDDRFESDFCKVMEEPWQYAFVHEISEFQLQRSIKEEPEAWEDALEVAYEVMSSGDKPLFDNVLYYHADYMTPLWDFRKLSEVEHIGNHIFYTDH